MPNVYEPRRSPLELPFQRLLVRCRAERRLHLTTRTGTTPGTTLAGAFGQALCEVGCFLARAAPPCPLDRSGHPTCARPDACPVLALYKPYSVVHRRHMPRPVRLRARALERGRPVREWDLEATLWGRRATAAAPLVLDVLRRIGEVGLLADGRSIPFAIDSTETPPAQTLAQAAALGPPRRATLHFETPFLHEQSLPSAAGTTYKRFHTDGEPPLRTILGNAAFELVAWDLEDRQVGSAIDRRARGDLGDRARAAAEEAAAQLHILRSRTTAKRLGLRRSRHNRQYFPLTGFAGRTTIELASPDPWPWLVTLALGGGGQHRALGFGNVRLAMSLPDPLLFAP